MAAAAAKRWRSIGVVIERRMPHRWRLVGADGSREVARACVRRGKTHERGASIDVHTSAVTHPPARGPRPCCAPQTLNSGHHCLPLQGGYLWTSNHRLLRTSPEPPRAPRRPTVTPIGRAQQLRMCESPLQLHDSTLFLVSSDVDL